MVTTRTVAQASSQPGQPLTASRNWREAIDTKGSGKPTRLVLHGVEGVGKTSFAAQAPKPIFMMARGETGLLTLIDNARLGEIPHFPETQTFEDVLSQVEWLATNEHDFRTLVIDTLNGVERLCHEMVCRREYGGVWSKNGFTSYMQGYEVSLADWRELLIRLDGLRDKRSMGILCLCHTKVVTFKNPEGADYDRYQPDMYKNTWGLTHKWSDVVAFLNFETFVNQEGVRAKASGGQHRMMYTERHAAWDAKNRLGLPEEISLGDSAAEAWQNFSSAVKVAKGGAA